LTDFEERSKELEKYYKCKSEVEFEVGEICYTRNYRNPNKRACKKVLLKR